MNLQEFLLRSQQEKEQNKKYLTRLKNKAPKNLDEAVHHLHDQVFEEVNCLECANCCKTTSPIFYNRDIERLSKHFRIRPSDFIEKYLRIDEDKDYVLKSSPCPFLLPDNYCAVYEDRPNACREYPHTNRKKIAQILDLTFKNTLVCPAVFEITKRLKKIIPPNQY